MHTVRWDLNFAAAGLFPGRGGRRCVRRGRSVGRMLGLCVTFCFVCLFSGWAVMMMMMMMVVERNVEEQRVLCEETKVPDGLNERRRMETFFFFLTL